MTRLCVSLTEKDTDAMLAAMRALPPEVTLAELRLDAMDSCDLERLCAGRDRAIVVTNRAARQGGLRRQDEAARLESLRHAARLGAEFVDVELDAAGQLGPLPPETGRIVSHHDFNGTPPDLDALLGRITAAGADVAKIAVTARDMADVPPVLDLLRRRAGRTQLIALSMGEEGVATRVLAPKFGAFLTYASLAQGNEAAPGQVPYRHMIEMYRCPRIGPATGVYGVVANPVAHSMSPAIHNAAFAAAGIDAVYLPFKVNDPAAFLQGFEPLGLRGLSVTIPHKEAMLPLMDDVDETAASIGAVNTVLVAEGRRRGINTDVAAAAAAIAAAARRAGMETLEGRPVLIVGAGGAGRAIAYGLRARGARLTIANRTVSRAERLAGELGAAWCGLDRMAETPADVLVNATSRGMWPRVDDTPVPTEMLREGMVVFDSVYNPILTRLLREAEAAGCVTAPGLEWFVNQAAAQFEFWTGAPAPRQVMHSVVRQRLTGGA